MKKLTALLFVFLILCTSLPSALAAKKQDTPEVTSEPIPEPTLSPDAADYDPEHPEDLSPDQLYALSAVLMTQDKGEIIFEKDADTIRYPASMTKILTVLLALMYVDDLDQTVIVSETAVAVPEDSSTMYLQAGEEVRFIDILYGTMLLSANDGANVIAETVSGSIPRFVALMNDTANALGCYSTHFVNPHGYHDDNHYSTARDIAVIAREAMKNDTFRTIAGTVTYQIPKTNLHRARTITTKSEYMLTGSEDKPNKYYYEYATGLKTGSHSRSGYCFCGSASKNGVDLISVVMFTGKRARWADTIKLMNYGFSQYMSVTPVELYNMNPITIETSNYSTSDTGQGKVRLICSPAEGTGKVYIVSTKSDIKRMADNLKKIVLIQYTRDFQAPVSAGEQLGIMTYYNDKGEASVYSLTASRDVAQRENVPKTLEQIISETYDDPNPFPPFSFELALILFGPPLLIVWLIAFFVIRRKRKRAHRLRAPKPVNRYVK
ncbi:MAG: D-alanyl-D-alanine carboxypeptidase [Clostridiales bacterium]|nr:D-alanyl-D-alanine carboxypeptidase [Clostridiales bacterium]